MATQAASDLMDYALMRERAEAAEAHANAAEVKADDLAAIAAQLEAERDEAQRELQHIRTMLDDGAAEDATALDMVKRLHEQYYSLRMSIVNNVSA